MVINSNFNFCWLCGDEIEDMEEVEVAPDCTMWLCTKHARMRDRTEDKEIRQQKKRETAAWYEWQQQPQPQPRLFSSNREEWP